MCLTLNQKGEAILFDGNYNEVVNLKTGTRFPTPRFFSPNYTLGCFFFCEGNTLYLLDESGRLFKRKEADLKWSECAQIPITLGLSWLWSTSHYAVLQNPRNANQVTVVVNLTSGKVTTFKSELVVGLTDSSMFTTMPGRILRRDLGERRIGAPQLQKKTPSDRRVVSYVGGTVFSRKRLPGDFTVFYDNYLDSKLWRHKYSPQVMTSPRGFSYIVGVGELFIHDYGIRLLKGVDSRMGTDWQGEYIVVAGDSDRHWFIRPSRKPGKDLIYSCDLPKKQFGRGMAVFDGSIVTYIRSDGTISTVFASPSK